MEEKIKYQKKIIIILSVIIGILIASIIGIQIYRDIDLKTYTIRYEDVINNIYGERTYKIEITCKKDITIKVNDFGFLNEDGSVRVVDNITYNGKTYKQNESFVIYAYKDNKIELKDYDTNKIAYRFTEIKLNDEKKFT